VESRWEAVCEPDGSPEKNRVSKGKHESSIE